MSGILFSVSCILFLTYLKVSIASLKNFVFILNETSLPLIFELENLELHDSQTWIHERTTVIQAGVSVNGEKYENRNGSLALLDVNPEDAGSYYLTARLVNGSAIPHSSYLVVFGSSPVFHFPETEDFRLGDIFEAYTEFIFYGEWVPNVTFTDSQSNPIATEDFGSNGTHLKIGIRRVLKESDVTIKCSVAFLSPPPAVIGSYQSLSSVDFIRNEVFVLNLTNEEGMMVTQYMEFVTESYNQTSEINSTETYMYSESFELFFGSSEPDSTPSTTTNRKPVPKKATKTTLSTKKSTTNLIFATGGKGKWVTDKVQAKNSKDSSTALVVIAILAAIVGILLGGVCFSLRSNARETPVQGQASHLSVASRASVLTERSTKSAVSLAPQPQQHSSRPPTPTTPKKQASAAPKPPTPTPVKPTNSKEVKISIPKDNITVSKPAGQSSATHSNGKVK